MKFKYKYTSLLVALLMVCCANASFARSVLSSGTWVKFRVQDDGVYGLSDARLRELGFSDPSKVKVFGYEPTVLLDHDPAATPDDLPVIQSMYANGQLLFYVRGNADIASELWSSQKTSTYMHRIHAHSEGATYFLSDADCGDVPIAHDDEESDESVEEVLTTHKSVIYHEDEAANYAEGGIWFAGELLDSTNPTESHCLELKKVADTSTAEMFYVGILSPEANNVNNYLQAVYDGGVTVKSASGTYSRAIDSHEMFRVSLRLQKLQLPENAINKDLTVNAEFAVNQSSASMLGVCALDYFMMKYDRHNDLNGETQVMMYFENSDNAGIEFTGGADYAWTLWNVTDPAAITNISVESVASENGSVLRGALPGSGSSAPNVVVAFRADVAQPEPEIIGAILNQDLHSVSVPDLLIVTSDVMMAAAEEAADFHRRHQGLDVEIVDQQQIFNEYSSGNVSPEGVRLFVNDLYAKDSGKLKAVLLIGSASFRNAVKVAPGNPEVVANENEDYSKAAKVTHNFCNDAFFGYIGGPVSTGNWSSRHSFYKVYGNEERVPVGRLPYGSVDDVLSYYKKAEKYMQSRPAAPTLGNIVLASDYATANEASHMYDAGTLATALGEKADAEITVTYAASNLFSIKDNNVNRKVMKSALERGTQVMAYFGHGAISQIGGSTTTADYLISNTNADAIMQHARFSPIYFLGSCHVGAFDMSQSNLAAALLKSETGGPIGVIASTRSVYQPENRALGQAVVKEVYNAENGTWIGEIWKNSLTFTARDVIDYICNQLSYNLLGDPAMPVFTATNAVEITAVNADSNTLKTGCRNQVSGVVTGLSGDIDTDFNGNVVLTVYDVPVKMPNLTKTAGLTVHSTYVDSVTTDFNVIGEYKGTVNNGRFSLDFVGPAASKVGNHRIQLYAYSSDGSKRGVGYLKDVALSDDGTVDEVPAASPIEILAFTAGDGLADEVFGEQCVLYAEISAPSGLSSQYQVKNPARLIVDGETYSNVARLMNYVGDGKYVLEYPINKLSLGRHEATLKIQDALGNWADATIEFTSFIAPTAVLSAEVDEETVNFDIMSTIVNPDSSVLVIESLSGELVKSMSVESFPAAVTLTPGAYRAFVQQQGGRTVTSTPKVDIFVN